MTVTTIVSTSATILEGAGVMTLTLLSGNTAAGVLSEKTLQALAAIDSAADTALFDAGMYINTAGGLAATVDGEYFSVPSPDADEFSILYLNSAGTAVEQKRFPTAAMTQAAIVAGAAAELSEVAADASADAAAASAVLADADRVAAEAARDASYSAAQSSGVYIYDTKALANAAVAGLADLSIVEVLADESQSGARTRYRKESGSLVFKIALEQFLASGTGAVPRTVQGKMRESVSVLDFGADPTGVASSVAAVNAAIAHINSRSGSAVLWFPPGLYNLKAGVTQKITKDHVSIVGENALVNAESGNIFYFDNTVQMRRGAIKGFTFQYTFPTVSTTAVPIVCNKVLYMRIREIRVLNAPAVLYLSDCSNIIIDDITGTTVNIAKNAIHFNSCAVVDADNVSLITDASLQPIDPASPFPNPPVSGNVFIRITGTTNDTYRFKSGVLCNRFHRGVYSTTATDQALLNVTMESVVLDYIYDKGVYIENTGGSVSNIAIKDPYIQAMSGIGIHIDTSGGLTNLVDIVRPKILMSGSHGICVNSSTGSVNNFNVIIDNPHILGSNRLELGGYDIYAGKSRVRVQGGRIGINSLTFTGYSAQGQYGIYFDGCDQYSVSDVELGGASLTNLFSNNPASDYKARSVRDNRPAIGHAPSNTLAYMTTDLVAVVSAETYTNTSPMREYVSIYAVSASGAATIEVNGVAYSARTEWSGILNPGDTLKVTTAVSCNRRKARLP